jgi:sucrose-phosphate synthase
MTEHPDFGGQLIYVKEICMELADRGHTVDIVTRQIHDPDWPEFDREIDYYAGYEERLRILRFPFGGRKFLRKELLWEHLDEYTDRILSFYGSSLPDFATAHYGDGGLSGVMLKKKAGLAFTFTGHSLGAQKLDKLGMNLENYESMESQYLFAKRIAAERLSMQYASRIITSTSQERFEQYAHALYRGAVDTTDDRKFTVIPPGVNTRIFTTRESPVDEGVHDYLMKTTSESKKPFIIVSSRLDDKKNHRGVVEAFALSKPLREKTCLGILIRGIDDPYRDVESLPETEQSILSHLLAVIRKNRIEDKVFFLNLQSQNELAASYRYFAGLGSVFALTAFYEPFGLAPIEAAACGLPAVATRFGGPSEIFTDGKGELVDPFDNEDIARGLLKGIEEHSKYAELQKDLVMAKYTWKRTAESYFSVIKQESREIQNNGPETISLDASERIKAYLSVK